MHKLQHHPVYARVLEPALLQVFAAAELTECLACDFVVDTTDAALIIASRGEQLLQLACQRMIDCQDILRIRPEQKELVQLQDALQFRDGLEMVIHAQVDKAIVKSAVTASFAHNKQRC